ncbi:MAG: PaaI family thioesterase [Gammaproteobacteria bacterium]
MSVTTIEDHMLGIPHARAIGMTLVSHTDAGALVRVPYAPHLVGDPDTGVIHGGVLTALLDNTCGVAVRPPAQIAAEGPISIATLDLRIDYMSPAAPFRDILAHAFCYKRTRHIAFVRGVAYQDSPEDPIATCVAAFMLGTRNEPRADSHTPESAATPTAPAPGVQT